MINNTPWQVLVNANNSGNVILASNNLSAVKKTAASTKKTSGRIAKMVVMPKRYSFDDNGGSYRGL